MIKVVFTLEEESERQYFEKQVQENTTRNPLRIKKKV